MEDRAMTRRLATTVVWLAYTLIPTALVAADRPPNDEGPRRSESARWIAGGKSIPADGGGPYPYSFIYTNAIGHESGVTRRDPSDVIQVGDTYYVWYTKVLKSQRGYPSGYPGSVWCATSPDGKAWTEQDPAIEPGPDDAWDGHGVFTPNILVHGGKSILCIRGTKYWCGRMARAWRRWQRPRVHA